MRIVKGKRSTYGIMEKESFGELEVVKNGFRVIISEGLINQVTGEIKESTRAMLDDVFINRGRLSISKICEFSRRGLMVTTA